MPAVPLATPQLPPPADPLSETLHLLRMQGTLYCRSELSAPWGIDIPALTGVMTFMAVTAGSCWLNLAGAEPRLLQQGSLTLLPHAEEHRICSDVTASAEPLFELPVERVSERYEVMRYGGGGALTQAMYGVVRFDHIAAQRLIALLPQVIHIDRWDDAASGWMQSTLRFIASEASGLRPGGETVITRLADVLVIQAIRSWLDSAPEADRGWLAALRDPQLGRALALIHRKPGADWTVASLAKGAGMSRSAFSARFSELVGETAMSYVTHWRMQLARARLKETQESLAAISSRYGYRSQASFCRAFKRVFGTSPGSVRETDESSPLSLLR